MAAPPAAGARQHRRQRCAGLQPQQHADLSPVDQRHRRVTKTGPARLTLTGDNTYTGGTTISAGTLQLGNGGTTGSVAGNIVDNGALAFNRSDDVTWAAASAARARSTQIGTGTTILTGSQHLQRCDDHRAGVLQVGNGGTTGSWAPATRQQGALVFNRSGH